MIHYVFTTTIFKQFAKKFYMSEFLGLTAFFYGSIARLGIGIAYRFHQARLRLFSNNKIGVSQLRFATLCTKCVKHFFKEPRGYYS